MSIEKYIYELDPDQLVHCKEIVNRRLAGLENQKKVKLWLISTYSYNNFDSSKYYVTFGEALTALTKAYDEGLLLDEPTHITFELVYPEEVQSYLED